MIQRTKSEQQKRIDELKGATFHKFNDTVSIKGTGVFSDMPKGKLFERVHRLVADVLVEKKYAVIV